jgi:hypothetical protein
VLVMGLVCQRDAALNVGPALSSKYQARTRAALEGGGEYRTWFRLTAYCRCERGQPFVGGSQPMKSRIGVSTVHS